MYPPDTEIKEQFTKWLESQGYKPDEAQQYSSEIETVTPIILIALNVNYFSKRKALFCK